MLIHSECKKETFYWSDLVEDLKIFFNCATSLTRLKLTSGKIEPGTTRLAVADSTLKQHE